MRDAAGQLADRFHLLRAEQRFLRALERLVRLAQLGDVVRDAVDAEDAAVLVAVDALGDQIGLRLAVLPVATPSNACGLPVASTCWSASTNVARVGLGIELEVVVADDLDPAACR